MISHNLYSEIISLENLFLSWREFRKGKSRKLDVQTFERNLEDNLFSLHYELKNKTYRHFHYTSFYITNPKLRHIHKAKVRDRIVHHAIFRVLYPLFDKGFIFDSYSCRMKKGTHKAVNRLESFTKKVSYKYYQPCFVLKCDVRKFFDSVDHEILLGIIQKKISDPDTLWLLEEIIKSFSCGIPIGNLTSQLFANIYLNNFDYFIKQKLRIKYYIRYCDDFVILSDNFFQNNAIVSKIENYLENYLKLKLHPDKILIRKLKQGIDFLGYVVLPCYRVLRTKTKKRMFKKINCYNFSSYLGLLKHGYCYKLEKQLEKMI